MLGLVARDWWVFAIRGIAALVFGILAFVWPERTLTVLVFLFGAYVLVDGASLLVALVRGDAVARRHAWSVAIMGVLGIVAGVVTFAWPGLTALSLLYLVAFPGEGLLSLVWLVGIWSVVFGVSSLGLAYRLHGIDADLSKPGFRATAH